MDATVLEQTLQHQVSQEIRLMPMDSQSYRVLTPFHFDDGDHLVIVLRQEDDQWVLSDDGHVFMRLSLEINDRAFNTGTRRILLSQALRTYGVQDRDGELVIPVHHQDYGHILYVFAQAILKITDLAYLARERVASTFMNDFKELIKSQVPSTRRVFDWYDLTHDPQRLYSVDCRISGFSTPLLVFALSNHSRLQEATINVLTLRSWGLHFRTLGICANEETLSKRSLDKFNDVSDRLFGNLIAQQAEIANYIQGILANDEVTPA